MYDEIMKWLNPIGAVASIVGLALTIYIFQSIKNTKTLYKRKIRLPQILKDIRENASVLNVCLNSFPGQSSNAQIEIARMKANIESLNKLGMKQLKVNSKSILRQIDATNGRPLEYSQGFEVYRMSQEFIQQLTNFQNDDKWEFGQ